MWPFCLGNYQKSSDISNLLIDLLTITLGHFELLFFYHISFIVCTIQPLASISIKTIIIIIIIIIMVVSIQRRCR